MQTELSPATPALNGHGAPPSVRQQRSAGLNKIEHVTFDDEGFPGEWCDLVVSIPQSVAQRWTTENIPTHEAFAPWIADWSFTDATGAKLPITPATLDELVPQEIFFKLKEAFWAAHNAPLVRLIASRPSTAAPPAPTPADSPPGTSISPAADASAADGPGS